MGRNPFIPFLVLVSILNTCYVEAQPDLFESLALLQLKAENGPWAEGVSTWQFGVDHCSQWKGVRCWSTGHVRMVHLPQGGLNGTLSRAIGAFPKMIHLNMRDNNLSGAIPFELTSLTTLNSISLQGNQLSGFLPDFLRNFLSLDELRLGRNLLQGPFPHNMFATLRQLRILDLEHNQVAGPIPDNLVDIPTLQVLALGSNNLSGLISPLLASSRSLSAVNLSHNFLFGILPSMWTNANLTSLDLSSNLLQGEIPSSLLILTNLTTLNLAHNNFTGRIPRDVSCQFGEGAFAGNPHLIIEACPTGGRPPGSGPGSDSSPERKSPGQKAEDGTSLSTLTIVALTAADVALMIISFAGFFMFYMWWKKLRSGVVDCGKDEKCSASTLRSVHGRELGDPEEVHQLKPL